MSSSFACSDFRSASHARRDLLRAGGLGLFGLSMPRWLQAAEKSAAAGTAIRARAKRIIFLYQFGGPSHLETFDMKPDAPDGIRGLFNPIASNVPGVQVCEHLPAMAKVMDRVTVVRSMTHTMKNHNSASYYALTGRAPPVDDIRLKDSLDLAPAYGSVVDRLAPNRSGMPTFVAHPYVLSDGSRTPGQFGSYLGKQHDPFLIQSDPNRSDFKLPELSLPSGLSLDRLEDRRHLQQLVDKQGKLMDYSARARGLDAYYETALEMLRSPAVAKAFDLSAEKPELRDRYGRTTYGQSCLLARRLVEAGVKFVSVYFAEGIGGQSTTSGGWDTHGFNDTRMFPIMEKYHLPSTNQTLPVLLTDLDERGLLDETLVVWVGEFGRTPKINKSISRDHWPDCYTALLAGGGVKRGYVHGASDKNGAYPLRDPVKPDDLAATMFYLLGIDPESEVYDASNRPLAISAGKPVFEVMA
ncbi:MAG: DUF1501 domain-containing protein [Planctomycetes bacterium]|nr:DUF1501 domain-containing protein [Planctomycetota bacterium]